MHQTKTRRPTMNVVRRPRAVPRALLLAQPSHKKAITMPTRTLRMMTDAECGLPEDPVAQTAAETFIAAWIGWQMKQEAKAQAQTDLTQAVEIPVADDSLFIRDVPADVLDGIATELRRIAGVSGDGPGFSTYQA